MTNTTRSKKIFFIAAPAMFAVYALLWIYFDNMSKGILYTAICIMFSLMLAIIPGLFSFIKAKDKYYAENIRPGIRYSIPSIIMLLTSVITLCSFLRDPFVVVFVIFQPLIVLASQYAENIIFVKDRNKSDSVKATNCPKFGASFLKQNKKSEYSIPDLGKRSKLIAVFLSVFMAVLPFIVLLLWKNPPFSISKLVCIGIVSLLWLVLCEKAGFSVLAYKSNRIRRVRTVLSLLAGVILLLFFILCGMIFALENKNALEITFIIIVLSLYIPVLWLYAESWITLYFLVSEKVETDTNVNVSVNNQTSKKSFKTKGFAKIAIIVLLVLLGIVSYKVYDKNHKLLLLSKEADSLYNANKYKEALKKYQEAYDKGYRGDEYKIAEMYYYGNGVEKDEAEAAKWYRKAAMQGHTEAQYKLGLMYYMGWGVTKNRPEAAKWYRKAAMQGHTEAQYKLGLMYYMGWGVSTDYEEAAKWFLNAAKSGHAEAQHHIGTAYEHGYGVKQDYYEAVKWFKKSADQGETLGILYLGRMYEKGLGGLPQSNSEAIRLYKKANAKISGIADDDLKRVRGY